MNILAIIHMGKRELYVPASYIMIFQISVDFYYVPVGGRAGGRVGLEGGG
jgi:hypothetical protein